MSAAEKPPRMVTFYCYDHRSEVVRKVHDFRAYPSFKPCCPVCFAPMYWVPNYGDQVPLRPSAEAEAIP